MINSKRLDYHDRATQLLNKQAYAIFLSYCNCKNTDTWDYLPKNIQDSYINMAKACLSVKL